MLSLLMRKGILLVLSLFLMVFMIGSVSANELIETGGIWIQQMYTQGASNCRALVAEGNYGSHSVVVNITYPQNPVCFGTSSEPYHFYSVRLH